MTAPWPMAFRHTASDGNAIDGTDRSTQYGPLIRGDIRDLADDDSRRLEMGIYHWQTFTVIALPRHSPRFWILSYSSQGISRNQLQGKWHDYAKTLSPDT